MIHLIWGFIIIAVVIAIALFTAVIPALILRLFRLRRAADALIFWHASFIAKIALFLCGLKVEVSGDVETLNRRTKAGEGFCFVCNHTSLLDIVLILGKLKVRTGFVTKRELAYVPVINLIIYMVHSVYINRKNLKSSVESVRKATKNIQDGFCMTIFPEGTRSKTGKIAPFKRGSFRMATESGACIVPLTVKGLRPAMEDRKRAFQRSMCYLHVGTPIKPPASGEREAVVKMIGDIEQGIRDTYDRLGN